MPTGKIGIISDVCPSGNPTASMSSRELSLFCAQNNLNLADMPSFIPDLAILKKWIKPNDPNTGGWFDIVRNEHVQHPDYPNIPEMGCTIVVNDFASNGNYSDFVNDQCVILDNVSPIDWEVNTLVDINFDVEDPNMIYDQISEMPVELGPEAELQKTCSGKIGLGFMPRSGPGYLAKLYMDGTRLQEALLNGMTTYAICATFESTDCSPITLIYDGDVLCALEKESDIVVDDPNSFYKPDRITPFINNGSSDTTYAANQGTQNDVTMSGYDLDGNVFNHISDRYTGLLSAFGDGMQEWLYIIGKCFPDSFPNAALTRFTIIEVSQPEFNNAKEVLHIDFSQATPIDLVSGVALSAGPLAQYDATNKFWKKNSTQSGAYASPISYVKLSNLPLFMNFIRDVLQNNAKYRITCEYYQNNASTNGGNMNIMTFGTSITTTSVVGTFGLASASFLTTSAYNDANLFRYNISFEGGSNHHFQCFKNATRLSDSTGSGTNYALKNLSVSQLNNYYILLGRGNNSSNSGGYTYLKSVIVERL